MLAVRSTCFLQTGLPGSCRLVPHVPSSAFLLLKSASLSCEANVWLFRGRGAAEPVWLPELIQEGPPVCAQCPGDAGGSCSVSGLGGLRCCCEGWEVVAEAVAHPSVPIVTE